MRGKSQVAFTSKVERSSCSRLTDHVASFVIRLWYSVIFQSVASSSGGLWAVYEVMIFTPKPCSHWPRLYCWRSPNVCTIGGQYVITATGRPNVGHSFCAILNMIWVKNIIFEPWPWHGRVVSYERMVSTALLYVFNQALCNLHPTSIAHSLKQVPARLFLCLYSSEPKKTAGENLNVLPLWGFQSVFKV